MNDASNVSADAPAPDEPVVLSGGDRVATVPLQWPVSYAGKNYAAISIRRLSASDVAQFVESLKGKGDAVVRWPIYFDADGALVPEAVLDGLDDDDMFALEARAVDFLPRRFRGPDA